jgi:hypothetical protein
MGILKLERTGAQAGFGLPKSRLTSSGEQAMSALSAEDQAAVEALFRDPASHQGSGQVNDGFTYSITRVINGKDQTVKVPESAVPKALKDCMSDKLT